MAPEVGRDEGAAGPEAGQGRKRAGRARIADIARLAGVSTASVDRVLNRRPGVRPALARRVLKAAQELDYIVEADAAGLPAEAPLRLTVLLPAGTNQFLSLLGRTFAGLDRAPSGGPAKCQMEYIRSFNPELLARRLLQCARGTDGVAFMALEHPAVREAVNTLAERRIPAVTLISDITAARAAYLGLDNRAAGRTAGYLIARFLGRRPAKVAMIAGSLSYRAHEEREMGFLHLLQDVDPPIQVVGLREGHDDEAMNHRQTRRLLTEHPDLAAIYNIGGGSDGIARALKEVRRAREVVLVGHGLTRDTRALLIDGTMDAVITQDPRNTAQDCLAVFENIRTGRDAMAGIAAPRTEIILRENLPA